MPHLHPLRSTSMSAAVVDIGTRAAADARDEFEASVATVAAVGEMLDRLQRKVEEQVAQLTGLRKEVHDLTGHGDATQGRLAETEITLQQERERADRAERLCQQLTVSEREAQEKIKRLVMTVRNTFFKRTEPLVSLAVG